MPCQVHLVSSETCSFEMLSFLVRQIMQLSLLLCAAGGSQHCVRLLRNGLADERQAVTLWCADIATVSGL